MTSFPATSRRGRSRPLRIGPALVRAFTPAVAVGLGALAVTALLVSFASYDWVKVRLDAHASDNRAQFTYEDFQATVTRLRVLAAGLLAAVLVVGVARRWIERRVSILVASFASSSTALRTQIRSWVAEESRVHLVALPFITVAALAFRIPFLFQPMRYDEANTFIHFASQPLYVGLTAYTAPNNHLFHTLLVHVSQLVFGNSPWVIRLPALAAGVLLVPATYLAARMLYDKYVALVAASLVSTASLLIEFSTNARGYSLLALIFILLLALATYLQRSDNPAGWLVFAVLGAIGFYTVPVMLYAFGTIVVWLLASIVARGEQVGLLMRRLALSVVTAAILTLVLYAPVLAASGAGSVTGNEYVTSRSWSYLFTKSHESLGWIWDRWHRDIPTVLAIGLATAFAIGLVYHRRMSRYRISPVLAAVLWIIPVLIIQRVAPFERVFLFLVPLYLMTAAAGIAYLARPLAPRLRRYGLAVASFAVAICLAFGVAAVVSDSVFASEETGTFRDGERVTLFLEDYLRPGDRVLVTFPVDSVLEYYFGKYGLDASQLLYSDFDADRVLAVVKTGPGDHPVDYLISENKLTRPRLGQPVVIRRYDQATVYEFRKAG